MSLAPGRSSIPFALFALLWAGCNNGVSPASADLAIQPEDIGDGWRVSGPSQQGMSAGLLQDMYTTIVSGSYPKTDGIVVARGGHLVFEAYFNGFRRDKRHDLRSATKSITSAIVGIAADRGHLAIADSIHGYLRSYEPFANWDDRKAGITIEHLLTMTPGWTCNDWQPQSPGNEEQMYETDDWVRFIVDLPMANPPGTTFGYCTGGIVVAGEVVAAATGMPADTFAARHLFTPLGITNYNWEYTPSDQLDAGGHIWMTPRDMAKIGQMFLDEGLWQGERILSAEWIAQSTDYQVTAGSDEFGYLWWRSTQQVGGRQFDMYSASGNGGQYIFVVPSADLVAAFTGSNYNSPRDSQPYEILRLYILAAISE